MQGIRDRLGLAGYANSPQLLELTKVPQVQKPEEYEPSDNPFEVTIPTAVVDVPEDSTVASSFTELLNELDTNPQMDWSAFSSTLGTSVFQDYLELTDDNKQLRVANQDLSQQVEILTQENLELSQKLETQNTKPTVMAGIENAGFSTVQQILRKHKPNG